MLILFEPFLRRSLPPRSTLHLVAHPVDLLDVREDHLGVDPVVPDHGVHVVGSEEVRDAGVPPVGYSKEMTCRNYSPILP